MSANGIIKALMKESGFSMARMGTILGVKGKTLSRRLSLANPTIDHVLDVLDVLGYELVIQRKRAGGRRSASQMVITREGHL